MNQVFHCIVFLDKYCMYYLCQTLHALNNTEAMEAMAFVVPGLGLGAPSKCSHGLQQRSNSMHFILLIQPINTTARCVGLTVHISPQKRLYCSLLVNQAALQPAQMVHSSKLSATHVGPTHQLNNGINVSFSISKHMCTHAHYKYMVKPQGVRPLGHNFHKDCKQ